MVPGPSWCWALAVLRKCVDGACGRVASGSSFSPSPGRARSQESRTRQQDLPRSESLHPLGPVVFGIDFTKGQVFVGMTERGWA